MVLESTAPNWSYQPYRLAWLSWFSLRATAQMLLGATLYLVPAFRPVREWHYQACVYRLYATLLFEYVTKTRDQRPRQVQAGKEGDRFELISPSKGSVYDGIPAPTDAIRPIPVPGIWSPAPLRPGSNKGKKVIIHFPGGAFVMAFDLLTITPMLAEPMLKETGADYVLVAQNRLARDSQSRFPAALQDALTFYSHVLSLGVDPQNVIISGDSAGGNLAVALLRYLHDQDTTVPLPGGVMAWSPWVDVEPTAGRRYNESEASPQDILYGGLLQWGAEVYPPATGGDYDDHAAPYVSPLDHPFRTDVPLYIHGGEREVFFPAIRRFADQMREVNGDKVGLYSTPDYYHDLMLSWQLSGHPDEVAQALRDAHKFFEHHAD